MSGNPEFLDVDLDQFLPEPRQQTYNLMNDPSLMAAFQKQLGQQLPGVIVPIVKRICESFLSTLQPMMEELVRKIVKEQLEIVEKRLNVGGQRITGDETHFSEQPSLALKFSDKVSEPVYTGTDIKGKQGDNIRVELIDADENLVVSGSEASSKVEIVVLRDGDSSSACGESDSSTKSSEKKQRKPQLSKRDWRLKGGIAGLDNLKFKNKSTWTRNCRIRLVARMVGNRKVKNAETEPFCVRDHRGGLYKKSEVPSLSDKIWCLKGIRRNGEVHKRLQEEDINTVEQFLQSLNTDPQSLKQRLNISAKMFKVIVDHAKTCQLPEDLHVYDSPSCERDDADAVVESASENREAAVSYNNEASPSVVLRSQVPNDASTSPYSWPNEVLEELVDCPLHSPDSWPNEVLEELLGSPSHSPDSSYWGSRCHLMGNLTTSSPDIPNEFIVRESYLASVKWKMLFYVLKWISVRKIVARKLSCNHNFSLEPQLV